MSQLKSLDQRLALPDSAAGPVQAGPGPDTLSGNRNRAWLFAFAQRPVDQTARARHYLRRIEQAAMFPCQPFMLPASQIKAAIKAQPQAVLTLQCIIDGSFPNHRRYVLGRAGAALIGHSAFLWRTPASSLYQDCATFEHLVDAMRAFANCQDRDGNFNWGDHWSAKGHLPHHEHAWRLEPLIWARIWMDNALADTDKRWMDAMIARAARRQLRFARESPNDVLQYCNRGCVWLSIVELCGLFLNEDRYRQATQAHARRILHAVLAEDGEVIENYLHYHGGGPDSGYSYTIWAYAMMYRLLSGTETFDDRLMRSLQWMLRYTTRHGEPLAGAASVRKVVDKGPLVEDLLPALEFYADHEPFLDRLAHRFARHRVRHVIGGHTVDPAIWALLLHRPRPKAAPAPRWYRDHEDHHEHQASHYSIVHHRYQTAVVYRGLFDCRGLQSFAYGDEPAIVQHAPGHVSSNRVGKTDSAAMQVTGGLYGWEVFLRRGGPGNGHEPALPATVILTRRGQAWEAFIFTRASVICLTGVEGAKVTRFEMNWALQETDRSLATLDRKQGCVTFAGRRGQIHTLGGRASLHRVQAGQPMLQLRAAGGPLVTGLGAGDLHLEKLERRRCLLHFADATGRYRFSYARMFDDRGQLDRVDQWQRLEKFE